MATTIIKPYKNTSIHTVAIGRRKTKPIRLPNEGELSRILCESTPEIKYQYCDTEKVEFKKYTLRQE